MSGYAVVLDHTAPDGFLSGPPHISSESRLRHFKTSGTWVLSLDDSLFILGVLSLAPLPRHSK